MKNNIEDKIKEELWKRFKSVLGNSSIDNKTNSMYDLEAFVQKALKETQQQTLKEIQGKVAHMEDRNEKTNKEKSPFQMRVEFIKILKDFNTN